MAKPQEVLVKIGQQLFLQPNAQMKPSFASERIYKWKAESGYDLPSFASEDSSIQLRWINKWNLLYNFVMKSQEDFKKLKERAYGMWAFVRLSKEIKLWSPIRQQRG